MSRTMRLSIRAFTLVEIMIVVLVIGILLAIAIPNFNKARENSQTKACIANLKQIASAKEQWAIDNKKGATDTPTADDLYGSGKYIQNTPQCPTSGTYTIGNMSTAPTCSAAGHSLATP